MTWTEEAEERLRAMAKEGSSITDVAEALGSTRGSVAKRASKLGVRFLYDKARAAARLSAASLRSWRDPNCQRLRPAPGHRY